MKMPISPLKTLILTVFTVFAFANTGFAAIIVDATSGAQVSEAPNTEVDNFEANPSPSDSEPEWDASAPGWQNSNAVWTFQLANLPGPTITDADISLGFRRSVGLGGGDASDNEFGSLFVRNSLGNDNSITIADHIAPGNNLSPSGWTLIQSDFVTKGTSGGQNVSLSSTGKTNLINFLNTTYTAGEYLMASVAFEFNGDTPGGSARYEFTLDTDRFDESVTPHYQLSVTGIPEPSALALLGIAFTVALFRRRRR
jgi:hypothetical protein